MSDRTKEKRRYGDAKIHRVLCWRGWPIVRWTWRGGNMRPNYWLDAVLWWLAPWRFTQCCEEQELIPEKAWAYCIRRKGHPWRHETNDGKRY